MTASTASPQLTMYSTSWCSYCVRLKRGLRESGISFTEVDIERDPAAAAFVQQANGGYQTVPTVLFADGRTATNPSIHQVRTALGR